jgi:hypothetical protein
MDSREVYGGDYFNGKDIETGQSVRMVISEVTLKNFGQNGTIQNKLILAFDGEEKEFVVNKTTQVMLGQKFGWDTDSWVGHKIEITGQIGSTPKGPANCLVITRTDVDQPPAPMTPIEPPKEPKKPAPAKGKNNIPF